MIDSLTLLRSVVKSAPLVTCTCTFKFMYTVNPKQAGGGGGGGRGGGIRLQAGSSLCCAETAINRKLKRSDFYYIVEECLV